MKRLGTILVSAALVFLLAWKVSTLMGGSGKSSYPMKPVQVVIPYLAGGGTDSFARIMTKAIEENDLFPQPMVIINQPGGAGTIASRFVKNSRPDGYRILCHIDAFFTAKLSGTVPFGPEAFTPIAETGTNILTILVREDAPYKTVRDMLQAAKESPNTLRFGADLGSPAHFAVMALEAEEPGAKFNVISSGGGQRRYIDLIGGHLDAAIFSLFEYHNFRSPDGTPPDRNIRLLVMLSEKGDPSVPDAHTCLDEGLDVVFSTSYIWWAPLGTPGERISMLADTFDLAMQLDSVQERLRELSIGWEFNRGDALHERIDDRMRRLGKHAIQPSHDLPNFPLWTGLIATVLGGFILVLSIKRGSAQSEVNSTSRTTAIWVSLCMICYILVLQFSEISYALATAGVVFFSGCLMAGWNRDRITRIALLAVLTGLATEFIFTQIFTLSLP